MKQLAVRSLTRYIENFPDAIIDIEVLGPPDIEKKVGLTASICAAPAPTLAAA